MLSTRLHTQGSINVTQTQMLHDNETWWKGVINSANNSLSSYNQISLS